MAYVDILNKQQKRQRYLTHLQEDDLENIFIRLKTKLDIVEQIVTIFKDTQDPVIQKQIYVTKQEIRNDIMELTKRGTSLIDIFARLGGVLFKAEIFKAQEYLSALKDKDNHVVDLVNEDMELYRRQERLKQLSDPNYQNRLQQRQYDRYGRFNVEEEVAPPNASLQQNQASSSYMSGVSPRGSQMSGLSLSAPQPPQPRARSITGYFNQPQQQQQQHRPIHQQQDYQTRQQRQQQQQQIQQQRYQRPQAPRLFSPDSSMTLDNFLMSLEQNLQEPLRIALQQTSAKKDIQQYQEQQIQQQTLPRVPYSSAQKPIPQQRQIEREQGKKTPKRTTRTLTPPKTHMQEFKERIKADQEKEMQEQLISPFKGLRQSPPAQEISFAPSINQQDIQHFGDLYTQIQQYNDLSQHNILQLGNLVHLYIDLKAQNAINLTVQDVFDLISQFVANSVTVEGQTVQGEQVQAITDKYNNQTQIILNNLKNGDDQLRFVITNLQNIYNDLVQLIPQQPVQFHMEGYQQEEEKKEDLQQMSQIEYVDERGRPKTPGRPKEKTRQPSKSPTRNINKGTIQEAHNELQIGNIDSATNMLLQGVNNFINKVPTGQVKLNPNTDYMTTILKELRDKIGDQQVSDELNQILQQRPRPTTKMGDQRQYYQLVQNWLQSIQQQHQQQQVQAHSQQVPQVPQLQDDLNFQQMTQMAQSGDWLGAIDILKIGIDNYAHNNQAFQFDPNNVLIMQAVVDINGALDDQSLNDQLQNISQLHGYDLASAIYDWLTMAQDFIAGQHQVNIPQRQQIDDPRIPPGGLNI